MRRCLTALLVVGVLSTTTARDAAAQPSEKDIAAYVALNLTPVGALVPVLSQPLAAGQNSFSGRAAHFSPSSGEGSNSFGATLYRQMTAGVGLSGTVGYFAPSCTGCEGAMIAGVDGNFGLWNSVPAKGSNTSTEISLQGSVGYGKPTDGSALSAAVGIPLALYISQSNKSKIGLFVTPGFGWGQISDDVSNLSESGTRPMVGAGASWSSASGWGIHGGFQKIIIEDGGNVFGLGVTWRPM